MAFKVGDSVMVLDEDFSGIVTSVQGNAITLETEDGFFLEFQANELVLSTSEKGMHTSLFSKSSVSAVISQKEVPKRKNRNKVRAKDRYEPTMEVDLHIHQLVKSYKGMSNYDMLSLQLDTAKNKLDWAIKKRIQKIVFIHGVGEGVLKSELDFLFGRYDNIKFYAANYQKYGLGATEVYIFQNNKAI